MKFDPDDPPLWPDESLDPNTDYEKSYVIPVLQATIKIAPGDWVDVSTSGVPPDEKYGTSFQVCKTYDSYIGILLSSDFGESYSETVLSPYWITNNYRKML